MCKDRMALYKYFSQDGPTLPRKIMCKLSALTQKDLEKANAKVKCSIEREAAKPQKASPQGKYNDYTPQERAWIRKYAAENGPTKAAKHFSQVLNKKCEDNSEKAKIFRLNSILQSKSISSNHLLLTNSIALSTLSTVTNGSIGPKISFFMMSSSPVTLVRRVGEM